MKFGGGAPVQEQSNRTSTWYVRRLTVRELICILPLRCLFASSIDAGFLFHVDAYRMRKIQGVDAIHLRKYQLQCHDKRKRFLAFVKFASMKGSTKCNKIICKFIMKLSEATVFGSTWPVSNIIIRSIERRSAQQH